MSMAMTTLERINSFICVHFFSILLSECLYSSTSLSPELLYRKVLYLQVPFYHVIQSHQFASFHWHNHFIRFNAILSGSAYHHTTKWQETLGQRETHGDTRANSAVSTDSKVHSPVWGLVLEPLYFTLLMKSWC